jgi:hypothetical protein
VEFIDVNGPNNSFFIGSNPALYVGVNYLLLAVLARLFPSQLYSNVKYTQNSPINCPSGMASLHKPVEL